MMGVRAQQKEKTLRSLVEAAFSQLSAERSFASLSLREVAREAGIAPTSFYRHFRDVDELGLTMVDESGLMLRQLMRQARQRIAKGGSATGDERWRRKSQRTRFPYAESGVRTSGPKSANETIITTHFSYSHLYIGMFIKGGAGALHRPRRHPRVGSRSWACKCPTTSSTATQPSSN